MTTTLEMPYGHGSSSPPPFLILEATVLPQTKKNTWWAPTGRVFCPPSRITPAGWAAEDQSVQPSGFMASTTEGFTLPRDHTLTVGGHNLEKAAAGRGGLGVSLAVGVVP